MKRFMVRIIFSVLILTLPIGVLANSGPVYWRGYPYWDVMAIKENSPIIVEKENLLFDFSNIDKPYYTLQGDVTATYNMVNPTTSDLSVQMAFPLISSLADLKGEDIKVTADGKIVPFEIYPGNVVNSYGNPFGKEEGESFDFADIIGSISPHLYQSQNFTDGEKGKLYHIEVKPIGDQKINFAVEFDFDKEKSKIVTSGFTKYKRKGEHIRIGTWCYQREFLKIFVLGEDVDFHVKAYMDGKLEEETDLYDYQIWAEEVEVEEYLKDLIKEISKGKNYGSLSGLSSTQLYNLYGAALDNFLTRNQGYCWAEELGEEENYQRIFFLVYTVDFKAEERKEVEVGYKISGTMDKTETVNPQYSFKYLLNPAKNWHDFKNLNVEIITPAQAPYLINSTINFNKGSDNTYTATLSQLPEEDLSFTLYNKEKITLTDKLRKYMESWRYFLPLLITPLMVGIIIYLIVFIRGRFKDNHY